MNKPSAFQKILDHIAKNYGKHPGKMLVHTGVIGWVLSSVAQVGAIVFNDKIPNEQKSFLIPQEIADAVVNILSFYIITQGFTSLGSKLVTSGKWLPKSVKNFLIAKGAGDKLGKMGFDVYKSNFLTPSATRRLDYFKNGIDIIFTTIGTVISCNLVTPIGRNKIAAFKQKQYLAKMNKPEQNSQKPFNTYYEKPSMQVFLNGNMKI